jgi:hypothetical protein
MSNYLYIRLYIPNDNSYATSLQNVNGAITEIAPDCWVIDYQELDFGQEERELVYKLDKLQSYLTPESTEIFFSHLQEFFSLFHKYLPSFTQNSHASE